jgi:hypothetical protein
MNARRAVLIALFAAAMLAGGCAMQPKFDSTVTDAAASPGARVTSLYVYSFLDLRESDLGSEFMKQFERILGDELRRHGVKSRQVWYARLPSDQLRPLTDSGMQRLPVAKVVADHARQETEFGATHRLVIVPTEIKHQGHWVFIDMRADVIDRATGNIVWTTHANARHTAFSSVNDNAEERARQLAGGLVEAMRKAGLVK